MERIKALIKKLINKETVTYVFFGVLTTLVNFLVFKLFDVIFHGRVYLLSNTIAWIVAVAFAYLTNKLFVFESKSWQRDVLKKEIPGFLSARIASFFIEEAGLWFFVDALDFGNRVFDLALFKLSGKMTAKIILGVFVIVFNYVLSKFLIFAKKKKQE